jgi:hypothetical protein
MENENFSRQIAEFVEKSHGWFYTESIYKAFSLTIKKDKDNTRQALHRLVVKGLLIPHPKDDGKFRKVENELLEMNFNTANPNAEFPVLWPFGLEEYVKLMPKSIVVVAGSPNAGKTAFLLNVVAKNQGKQHIVYFNSEMAVEEMKLRLDLFDDMGEGWCFQAFERSGNFADVIFPDSLNIIDFMEINDEFYKIAGELAAIHDKLKKGIAIIAIQKNPPKKDMKGKTVSTDMGRGGAFGLEKPRLYLAMDAGTLKIVKAKIWKDPKINPNNKEFHFKLVNGSKFVNVTEVINPQ